MKNIEILKTLVDKDSKMDNQKKIEEIEIIIETLDTLFEKGEECINPVTGEIVTDNEYDFIKDELYQLSPDSKIFTSVTSSKVEIEGNKIIHNPPMTSINKCNGTEEEKEILLHKWFEDCRKIDANLSEQKYYPQWLENFFCISYKHDGIALSLEYENGKLKRAGLRSKSGKDGTDVTDKIKFIENIPKKLPIKISCKIRGELESSIENFRKINSTLTDIEQFSNPRAFVAGSMGLKNPKDIEGKGIRFIAYNIIMNNYPYQSEYYETEIERAKWATQTLGIKYVELFPFSNTLLSKMEENHRKLDFMVDGAVISINQLNLQKMRGTVGEKDTGNPKGKIAYKFADEIKKITVKNIVWQTGRTGAITPVLIFDPVQIEGTEVSRCTAHNWGIIKTNKIGIGSILEIIKSGKIIPKIKKIIEPKGNVEPPKSCNICKGEIKEEKGNANTLSLVCINAHCPAQKIKRFNHYLNTIGAKGIAESTLAKLDEKGLINNLSDLYRLTPEILMYNGFTERTAALIFARIKMMDNPEDEKDTNELVKKAHDYSYPKVKIPMEMFIASLGMEGAGKEIGRILTQKYKNINEIRNLTIDEYIKIDGIGDITALSIYNYMKNSKEEINKLLDFIEPTVIIRQKGSLSGKSFVLSGTIEGGKKKWEKFIQDNGGTVKGSVGKTIDYLIAGDGSGAKSEKAKQIGIKIITEKELENMV